MFKFFNPNPNGIRVGDCAVRAVSKALSVDWETAYTILSIKGLEMGDMPSANNVWGSLLRDCGFFKKTISDESTDGLSVKSFCRNHKNGVFVIALNGHVVAAKNGDYFDSWDCGDEAPLYYYEKEMR